MLHLSPNVLVGALLDERYRIVQHIATGGVGHLFVVEDVQARGRIKPCFAAKVLRFEHLENDMLQARFTREIEATSRIHDPHVLELFHQGKLPRGGPYFVAELLPGMDLADRLQLNKRLAPQLAVFVAAQIAKGLAAAHAAGVVHRDLKPENVFLTHAADGSDHVKLLDFGFSWINDDPSEVFSGRLTLPLTGVGTPAYVAPEQAFGDIGRPAADIYSLGIVLYEMLAGHVPFAGSPEMILQQHVRAVPPSLERGSMELRRIVDRALAKEPANRYESASEMAEALLSTPEAAALSTPRA